jgi:hypothetical protein
MENYSKNVKMRTGIMSPEQISTYYYRNSGKKESKTKKRGGEKY